MDLPKNIETLDDLLAHVQKLHAEHGGAALVRKRNGAGDYVTHAKLAVAAVGKGDQKKLVSRGGIPCVLIV